MYFNKKTKIKTIRIMIDNTSILNLLDSNLSEVLLQIIKQTNVDNYKWYSTEANRMYICGKVGIARPTISRIILRLVKKGILLKPEHLSKGEYLLNSKLIKL